MTPPLTPREIAIIIIFALLPFLEGCATQPRYALFGLNNTNQESCIINGSSIITKQEDIGKVKIHAEIWNIMDEYYILAAYDLINRSTNEISLNNALFFTQCESQQKISKIAALDPEKLIPKLAKLRVDRARGRAIASLIIAAAASGGGGTYAGVTSTGGAYSGTYSTFDNSHFINTALNGASQNASQSDWEASLVANLDKLLSRDVHIKPAEEANYIMCFPLKKINQSKRYNIFVNIGQNTCVYNFELREY